MRTSVFPEPGDVTVAGSGVSPHDGVSARDGVSPLDGVSALDSPAIVDALIEDRRAPGRPRSARADEAIIEAVLDLLAEGANIETLSIEAVAGRAGVGKATIYRRWTKKEALIVHALAALKGPLPELAGESLRDDLLALLQPMGNARTTRAGRIIPCLIPELQRNPEMAASYRTLTEPRRELLREVLRRGIASGELRADLDVDATGAMLTGPLLAQSMLTANPAVDMEKFPEQIIDTILPGLRA